MSARINGARYDAASRDVAVRDRQLSNQAQERASIWECDAEADAAAAMAAL